MEYLGTIIITTSCILLHIIYCEISHQTRKRLLIFPSSDKIAFSAENVHKKYHWVYFTASTLHADRSHLINNLMFILGFAPNLEKYVFNKTIVSQTWYEHFIPREYLCILYFLGIYYVCGIFGWLITYISHRFINFPKQWQIGVAQHITSVGSSPNMYGIAIFASLCLPPMEPVGTIFGTRYTWIMVYFMMVVPFFVTNRYGFGLFTYFDLICSNKKFNGRTEYRHALNNARQTTLRALFTLILLGALFYILNGQFRWIRIIRRNTLYMYQWVLLYWLKILGTRYYNSTRFPDRMSQTDNASHIGGAIGGYIIGSYWIDSCCKYIRIYIYICILLLVEILCYGFYYYFFY